MDIAVSEDSRDYRLDRRYFYVFLLFQAIVLGGSLFFNEWLPAVIAGAVVAVLFVIGVLVRPWVIAPIIVLTTGLDSTGRFFGGPEDGGGGLFHLTGFHLAFALLIVSVAVETCLRRRTRFPEFEVRGPLLMLLACIAVSLIYSPNQPAATISFVRMCALVLFTYLTLVIIDSKKAVSAVLWSMVLFTTAGAVMGAYQVITGQFHLPVKVITALGGNVPRATGTFHNPNIFATFMMCGILPLLAVLLNHKMGFGQRVLFALGVIIGFGGLLASFSRSNWMATLVGVFVILWLSGKIRYFFILLFSSMLAVLALKEFVPFAEYIFERFVSIFTLFEQFGSVGRTSSTARIYLIIASLDMFADHPLLGIGWRAFPHVFSSYAPPGYPHWSEVNEPHTVITMVLGELGIVGFAAMLWFLLKVFFIGLSRFRQMTDPYLRAVQIGMIATFVSFQVNQSFNGDLANNMFWFGVGMLFAVQRIDAELREKGGEPSGG
jgi:putative inorganic carbon (hco3(-)) transporter